MQRLFMIGVLLLAGTAVHANVPLGSFDFNSNQFGNSLLEPDGGLFSSSNWLNVVNVNPGNPAYLTGPNFDTGIANIGTSGPMAYTIGYSTPIVNSTGNDLGVVVARFSTDDFLMAVSADGMSFSPDIMIPAGSAVDPSVGRTYFYGGSGPYGATLWVHPIDLGTTFGLSDGASIAAVRITGTTQLDLIRVAGFGTPAAVPAPGAILLGTLGAGLVGWLRRRRTL